jgi:predicted MFS family arabinose efflux permease
MWPGVLVVAVGYGLARYTYGLFVPEIRAELGLSTGSIGLVASGSYAGFLLASALTAFFAASTGPRLPVVAGAISAAAGMLLIALSEGPVLLAAGVVLAGTSPGFAYAPFSDAVVRLIPEEKQGRTYAVINAGTGFGVLFAGPVAIWAADSWRTAWLVFAAVALLAAVWNGLVLPSGACGGGDSGAALPALSLRWFVGTKSLRLFCVALVLGVASSAYWTFAVDLVAGAGSVGAGSGALFWTIVGASGIAGALAGDAVSRLGLRQAFLLAVLSLAASTALLAAAPGALLAVLVSATLFGAAFIFATGMIGLWSIGVFRDRPSAGFGAAFFLLSLGQFFGPAAFAVMASLSSLEAAFFASAAIMGATALIRPPADPGSGEPEVPAPR